MTFGSLFSGIGGLDLGLERAGLVCKWQVEIDPYCRQVLAKHWPDVPRHDDVKTFPVGDPQDWTVDLIAGGFPCQDVSLAGKGAGLDGERSGLWYEYARIIGQLRPRYVLIENVPALRFRGLDRVLCDLAAIGFDAEWQSLPASGFGAPHDRDRVFIVAYRSGERSNEDEVFSGIPLEAHGTKSERRLREWPGRLESSCARPDRIRWVPDPRICRVANGIPGELDRYRGLGNAVVPQVAEFIGRRLMQSA